MSSRSATVLVIFVVAVIAFCLASVFGAMTGPINIFPNSTDTGGVLDNLSAITDGNDGYDVIGSQDSYDYSTDDYSTSDDSSDDQQTQDTQVETYTETQTDTQTQSSDSQGSSSTQDSNSGGSGDSGSSDASSQGNGNQES